MRVFVQTVQSRVEIAPIIAAARGSTYCLHDLSALEENDSKPGLLEGEAAIGFS